jgi:hypothetical protein
VAGCKCFDSFLAAQDHGALARAILLPERAPADLKRAVTSATRLRLTTYAMVAALVRSGTDALVLLVRRTAV